MATLTHTPQVAAQRLLATWSNQPAVPFCPVVVGDDRALRPSIQEHVASPVPALTDPRPVDVLVEWCRAGVDLATLISGMTSWLAQRAGRNTIRLQASISNANQFFVRRLLRDASISLDSVQGQLIQRLCAAVRRLESNDPFTELPDLISDFVSGQNDDHNCVQSTMKILLDFVSRDENSVVLCSFTNLRIAHAIQSMVLNDSRIRIVFVFSKFGYEKLCEHPDSFFKATFQQLVIELDSAESSLVTDEESGSHDVDGGEDSSPGEDWARSLSQLPGGDELIRAANRHLQTFAEVNSQLAADRARSAAEAFLFQVISTHPAIEHEFELNRIMDFRFGSRNAEIDIACAELKIAIEVDGYFHFRDDDGYRRDRRKDVLLQRHGYYVLRFLANDVVPQIDSILRTVIDVISFRAQSLTQRGFTSGRKPK